MKWASVVAFLMICNWFLMFLPFADMTTVDTVSASIWALFVPYLWITIVRRERRRKAMRERHEETRQALTEFLESAKIK